jgi:hypothetical protein
VAALPPVPALPPAPGQTPIYDAMEPKPQRQGPFDHLMSPSADWQQAGPPGPGAYPPSGPYPQDGPYLSGDHYPQDSPYLAGDQYPQDSPYPGGGNDEPGGQYPLPGAFQQPGPPQPWPAAPAGAVPVIGAPALPAGPDQYVQDDAYPGPNGNGPGQFPPGQFGPGTQYGPGGGPGGQGLLGKLPFQPSPVAVGVAVAVAVAVGIFIVVFGVHALSSRAGSSPSAAGRSTAAAATPIASSATGTTSSTGTSVMTQQQAATALSSLLMQSGTDRAAVNAANVNVKGCTDLTADAQTFTKAAANRRTLLAKLGQLPGRSALSPAMLTDLTDGWQASATVDADLANWATSEVGHCTKNDLGNPAYTASLPYDNKATNDKTAFVKLWNGLARKYGLAVYQPSKI